MEESVKRSIIRFIAIFSFLLALLMIFDPSLRRAGAEAAGFLFNPSIAFEETKPVLTIFLAGVILILFTTLVRHFFIDWLKLAKQQNIMSAFQKEFREARISQNLYKIKKLTELQAEVMRGSSELSMMQLKPMGLTLLIALPIFMWLHDFIARVPNKEIHLFGHVMINITDPGPLFHLVPWWIIIYIFISIPFGQLFQKALKILTYKKRLK